MKGKKLVYIISDIEKSLGFEWTAEHLSHKFDLLFLLIGKKETSLVRALEKKRIRFFVISDEQYPSMLKKWIACFFILRRERPAIIHAHLWKAMLVGMTTGFLLRVPKRIFTRHHAMDHYRNYPGGRKWDRLCNWLSTDIVANSENVKHILLNLDGADASKVRVIHHGFDLPYFRDVDQVLIEEMRIKYNISNDKGPIIGVIARYAEWKGIQFIIPAFLKLRKEFPTAHLVLANAQGDFMKPIKILLSELPGDAYTEIDFENNLSALYKLFHVYVHTPIDEKAEAFGQTYVEALASGVPSVFTISGIASEFIKHKVNAYVVPYADSNAIEQGVAEILHNPGLSNSIKTQGTTSVEQFSLRKMFDKLDSLYGE